MTDPYAFNYHLGDNTRSPHQTPAHSLLLAARACLKEGIPVWRWLTDVPPVRSLRLQSGPAPRPPATSPTPAASGSLRLPALLPRPPPQGTTPSSLSPAWCLPTPPALQASAKHPNLRQGLPGPDVGPAPFCALCCLGTFKKSIKACNVLW